MIIHGPKNADYDTDLGPVMIVSLLPVAPSSTNLGAERLDPS